MDEMDWDHQVSPFATVGNIFAYAHYTESERNLYSCMSVTLYSLSLGIFDL